MQDTKTADETVLHAIESLLGAREEVDSRTTRIVHDGQLEVRGGTLEEARESTMTKQDYRGVVTFDGPVPIQNTRSTEARGYDVEFYNSQYRQNDDGSLVHILELSMAHESDGEVLLEIYSDVTDSLK